MAEYDFRRASRKIIEEPFQTSMLYKLTYYSLVVAYFFVGYPRYTNEVLKAEVYGPENSIEELKYFHMFSTKLHPNQLTYWLISVMFAIHNMAYPIYTMIAVYNLQYDYPNLSANSTPSHVSEYSNGLMPNRTDVQFGCLRTNCTKFSESNRFFDDLISLPVFKLCHPNLQPYYYPILDTGLFGLTMHTSISFCFAMVVVAMPVLIYKVPIHHDVFLFVMAPKTIHRHYGEVVRGFMIDKVRSMITFLQRKIEDNHPVAILNDQRKDCLESIYSGQINDNDRKFLQYEELQLRQLDRDYSLLSSNVQDYLDDCIPLVRSRCFRSIMAKQYFYLVCIFTFYMSCIVYAFISSAHITTVNYNHALSSVDDYIESMGCSIRIGDNEYDEVRVKVSLPATGWTWISMTILTLQYVPVALLIAIGISFGILFLQELNIEVAEQIDRIHLLNELTEKVLEIGIERTEPNHCDLFDYRVQDSCFRELRSLHCRNMRTSLGLIYLKSLDRRNVEFKSGREESIDLKRFAAQSMIDYGTSLDFYLNVLIKTHIGTRAFVRLIKNVAVNISYMILMCYATVYGLVLIILYFNRKFGGKDYYAIFYGTIALVATTVVVATAARVQAKSKHLISQIWRMIAMTWQFKDPRVQHMRTLWIRQVIFLDQGGGVTIKAFNTPVTYGSVIELILWSSTMTFLAFG